MARQPRIFADGAVFHVYCRTARGEHIFDNQDEADRWIDTVAFVSEQDGMTIFAWCLLSNHFHLVVKTHGSPLCRPMARIQGRYAKDINKRNRWTGRLWQSRYKARLVTDQNYLDHLVAYVHLNPVAAGMVDDPCDHGPTGHRALLGLEMSRLVDVDSALLCFHEDQLEARNIYQRSIRVVAEERWLRSGLRDLPWWKTVDDDDQTILRHLAPSNAESFDGRPIPIPDSKPPLAKVITIAESQLGLVPNQFKGRGRSRYESWCRCLLTALSVGSLGYRSKELADQICKSSVSVSRWLSEGKRLQLEDREFLRQLRALIETIDGL